jgi:hypothetical protein
MTILKKIESIVDEYDAFAVRPPQINVHGKEKVGTWIGLAGTMLIMMTVGAFSVTKIIQLTSGNNPSIVYQEQSGQYLNSNDTFDPQNFKLGVAFFNFSNGEVLDDIKHVRIRGVFFEGEPGNLFKHV